MEAIKPTNNDEKILAMVPELPEVPSFYKFRDIAKIMMNHNMFIKTDKGLQWQIDDLALKLEHCKTLQIPMTWANSLYIGNGKFGMEIDLMSWIVRTQCPDAQFILDHGNAVECVIKGRRTIMDKNAPWQEFKYTIEMAKANNLIRGSNWLLNPANMVNKNAYANAYRGLCRAELQNSYIREEIGADEDIETIQKPTKTKKPVILGVPLTGEQIDDLIETLPPSPQQPKKCPEPPKPENIPLGHPDNYSPEDLAAMDKEKNFLDEPMTLEQTKELASQILIEKKKSTKNKKEPVNPLEKLKEFEQKGEAFAQQSETKKLEPDEYMKWLNSMAVEDGFYLVMDARILGATGNDVRVYRKKLHVDIPKTQACEILDAGHQVGVKVSAIWMRHHGSELF